MKKILIGTDTSAADFAVHSVAELAASSDAELLVLYVRPGEVARDAANPRTSPDADGYLRRMAERFPIVRVPSGAQGSRWRVRESVPVVVRHSPCSVSIVDTRVAQ